MQPQDSTRPEGVKVTTAMMVAILVVELLLGFYTMHRMAEVFGNRTGGLRLPSLFSGGFNMVSILIAAVFVFLYWQGQNVGRWAVLIDSGLVILSGFGSIFSLIARSAFQSGLGSGLGHVLYFSATLNLLKACLAIYFFWYLNQPEVKAWFLSPKDGSAVYPPQGYIPPYGQQMPSPYAPVQTPQEPPTQQQPPTPPPGFTV